MRIYLIPFYEELLYIVIFIFKRELIILIIQSKVEANYGNLGVHHQYIQKGTGGAKSDESLYLEATDFLEWPGKMLLEALLSFSSKKD